jgi:2-C-methyl-D-erythritol 4-phosphate cytidylyltransferase
VGGDAKASAEPDAAAILVAAGRGERAGSDIPKQFLVLEGRPLFIHALGVLVASPRITHTTVVVPHGWEQQADDMVAAAQLPRHAVKIVAGGARRQDSVSEGLRTLGTEAFVLVHDAARPCLSASLVDRTIDAARQCGAATAALPITDTVMRAATPAPEIVDRTGLWAVQTPQVFEAGLLRAAHARARAQAIDSSDDGTLVLDLGHELRFVPGDWWNIKVTAPKDLERAHWILRSGVMAAPSATAEEWAGKRMHVTGDAFDAEAHVPKVREP